MGGTFEYLDVVYIAKTQAFVASTRPASHLPLFFQDGIRQNGIPNDLVGLLLERANDFAFPELTRELAYQGGRTRSVRAVIKRLANRRSKLLAINQSIAAQVLHGVHLDELTLVFFS